MNITNLEDDLQKSITKLYKEEGPKYKKLAVKNRPFERSSLVNFIHIFELYEESGSEVKNIEVNKKERSRRMLKNEATLISMRVEKKSKPSSLKMKNQLSS